MLRRTTTLFLGSFAVASLVLACGGKPSPTAPSPSPAPAPSTTESAPPESAPPAGPSAEEQKDGQEVTGIGFATRIAPPAEWKESAQAKMPKGAHSYLGTSKATPGIVYTVTSFKLDELEAKAKESGPRAYLTSFALGLSSSMKCKTDELKVERADEASAKKLGFKEAYAFTFKCAASNRMGIGFGFVGKSYWFTQFMMGDKATVEKTPLESVKPFLGSFSER